MPKSVDVLLVALSSPIQIGIYENGSLIDTITSDKKSSDILPVIFSLFVQRYLVKGLTFGAVKE